MTECVNYYSGNPLNRLSYLRTTPSFLSSALSSDKAKFILFNNLNPLAKTNPDGITLHTVNWSDVKRFIGDPIQKFKFVNDKTSANGPNDIADKLIALEDPILVFLGVDERSAPESAKSLPLSKPNEQSSLESHSPHGIPVWALDVSNIEALKGKDIGEFVDMRAGMARIPMGEAALAGEGRALIDWNKRNVFCPACGTRTSSVWAGWKKVCLDTSKEICASRKGIQNYQYPRTDAVVIMAILDPTKTKILLGRQKIWPAKFYSCLAGFLEPGESLEEAVRREVYEEAGIEVDAVYYHSTQPWPYPSSLMIGCIGVAKENQTIRCDLDNELEDAHYFSFESCLAILDGVASNMTREEVAQIDGKEGAKATSTAVGISEAKEGLEFFRLPPATAIAYKLVEAVARGEFKF